MDSSIFLERLIGLYLIIISLIWLLRKQQVDRGLKELVASKGIIIFSGVSSLVIGLAIAIGHPIWQVNAKGIITLIGYIAILQGIVRVAFTDFVQKKSEKMLQHGHWVAAVGLIIGLYLTYSGFAA